MLKTRTETAAKIREQLTRTTDPNPAKSAVHYGRTDLRELLDFIYGGPPANASEEIGGDAWDFNERTLQQYRKR